MTQNEILKATGIKQGGNFSRMLENLIYSDIIYKTVSYGETKKGDKYLLNDYFTQFYFSFIKDNETKDSAFWSNRLNDHSLDAWRGLSFERVCIDHIQQIKLRLGISGVATETFSFNKKGSPGNPGAQIDIVIDRQDQVTNLCEVKFSKNEYLIDKRYKTELENKINTYRAFGKNKNAVHLTMVTTYGLKPTDNNSIVQSSITLDDLFVPLR